MLSVPGASRWFERGVVAYSGNAKVEALRVDRQFLRDAGAVSGPAVAAMAEGLRNLRAWTSPSPKVESPVHRGSRRSPKPVGFSVIAVAGPAETRVEERQFAGTRAGDGQIARAAPEMLLAEVQGASAAGAQ